MRRYALLLKDPAPGSIARADAEKLGFALLCLAMLVAVVLGGMFYLLPPTFEAKMINLALFIGGALWIIHDMK